MRRCFFMIVAFAAAILSMTSCMRDEGEYIVDVQAHRGGMGLRPANTLEAMKHAIDLGVNTLEMDVVVTRDNRVVVCHDRYLPWNETTRPDGTFIMKEDPRIYLWALSYDEISGYDVGQRQHPNFPEQITMPAVIPLLSDVLSFAESYAKEKGLAPLKYNVEIKANDGNNKGSEGRNWPEYHAFVDTCMAVLDSFDLGDRLIIQCFDHRSLSYMRIKYPELTLSYLVGAEGVEWHKDGKMDFDKILGNLGFIPEWFSPASVYVNKATVEEAHRRGMKVVTWTVDDKAEMQKMIDCGVDAIISNYPDRLLDVVKNQ